MVSYPCDWRPGDCCTESLLEFCRFLLKYATRDEIELLGRGNGGIVEIRNAIASYEEPSPLFGFLRYRRRNVVIKYVPEDCSRLVQGEFRSSIEPIYLGWGLIYTQRAFLYTLLPSQSDSPPTIPYSK